MQWVERHSDLLAWLGGFSLLAFIATLIAIPWLVARIPKDYFVTGKTSQLSDKRGGSRWLTVALKNIIGFVLLLAGALMLILPGQGVLTIVLGLSLLDFPGKRPFILWLVGKPAVYKSLDWLRRKRHAPPLNLPRH